MCCDPNQSCVFQFIVFMAFCKEASDSFYEKLGYHT